MGDKFEKRGDRKYRLASSAGRDMGPQYDAVQQRSYAAGGEGYYEGDHTTDWQFDQDRYGRAPYEVQGYRDRPSRTSAETWRQPGPYSGRGPKGYRRSDETIAEDVCERLTQHGYVDASDIEVKVEGGEVTLQGTVDNRRTKRLAEDIAASVAGVSDVHNRLRLSQTNRGEGIRIGMDVVGANNEKIGEVKEVRQDDFLVDRPRRRDVYVPLGAVRSVSHNRIILHIRDFEVNDQNWLTPPLVEAPPTHDYPYHNFEVS